MREGEEEGEEDEGEKDEAEGDRERGGRPPQVSHVRACADQARPPRALHWPHAQGARLQVDEDNRER